LLERALSLDPNNAKAHILKAEHFHYKGAYTSEHAELDKAKETGTNDRWLLIGYAGFYRSTSDFQNALRSYSEVRRQGPGESLEQRNAYIAALNGLADFATAVADEKTLRELIGAIRKDRDPRDAWALGNLAISLVNACMFDEAIAVSREALQTMNYGAGRMTLAAALFGKASELTLAGKPDIAAPLIREARDYGYDKSSMLGYFEMRTPKIARLRPALEALIK
jgi:tetratricopeptide (TPR) repeat protein